MVEKFSNESSNFESQDKRFGEVLGEKDFLEKILNEKKDKIFLLEWDEKNGNQNDAKKIFSKYLDGLSDEEKKNFVEIMRKVNSLKLEDYVYENGYPINQETYNLFVSKLGNVNIDRDSNNNKTKEDKKETKEDKKETKEELNNIKLTYKSVFTQQIIDELGGSLGKNLQILYDGKDDVDIIKEAASNVDKELKNQDTLNRVLLLLTKESDKRKYEDFKSYLISRDSSFESMINRFEFENVSKSEPVRQSINTSVIENTTKYGDMYLADLGNHLGVKIDPGKMPPEGIITNGKYELKADIGVGKYYEPTMRYQMDINELNEELDGINKGIDDIKEKGDNVNELDLLTAEGEDELYKMFISDNEIKSIIENYDFPLTIETSKILKSQIFSVLRLRYSDFKEKSEKKQSEAEERKDQYYEELDELKREYFENIGKKQKEIIKFLESIGFDIIPQEITDQLIEEYKSNVLLIPGLNLNKGTMDIKNGRFGESVTDEGGDMWKDNLVKFLEKAIYGEVGSQDSIFKNMNFKGEMGANINSSRLLQVIADRGIVSEGSWNINVLRNNLKKKTEKNQK